MIHPATANNDLDTDHDGLPDKDEINTYYTNPNNPDSDGDGFSDWIELNHGYSPYNPSKDAKLGTSDADKDGLTDEMEILFHANPLSADSNGNGVNDGQEIKNGMDPSLKSTKLAKTIEVNLKKQQLSYFLGKIQVGSYKISSGKASTPTPKGNYKITNKSPRAWSAPYGLWMPFWMGLNNGRIGLHELPEWPNGKKEGASHIGRPVSHGCVRLGVGPAKQLYNWAEVGTEVVVN